MNELFKNDKVEQKNDFIATENKPKDPIQLFDIKKKE